MPQVLELSTLLGTVNKAASALGLCRVYKQNQESSTQLVGLMIMADTS